MEQEGHEDRSREQRDAEVRCLSCLGHFPPAPASIEAVCPYCGAVWRLTWFDEKSVKIRGPVNKP